MKVVLIFLVLVGIAILVEATSIGTTTSESPPSTSCESRLALCEHNLSIFRHQKERAKVLLGKLDYQSWSLEEQKKELNRAIDLLTYQVNNPGAPVPGIGLVGKGTGVWQEAPELRLADSQPCDAHLKHCEESAERMRNATRSFEEDCTSTRSRITQQSSENAQLRSRADALKRQLASMGVPPSPSSQYRDSDDLSTPEHYDTDLAEIDRHLAELIATAKPNSK